ncbi:RNA polymerase sigma factor [Methylosinus sp. Sm6]|uniref:RNA polymerase sigma factor n=1 Tax=Methylosinus sp. Sm6 TaxID=2866948 RepID=UPI001C9A13A2|nr:sigma-70 family RNA polymerase sigma factor [Methylosinus sp. Sm6]MBY6243306.1 sigma-70 family RNA polymerase sigma factor [Methylosinus sp. Sm6]
MTIDSSRAALIDFLLDQYDDLKRRLARRLGAEAAADALQDTFVRLNANIEIGPIRSPRAYLLRIAVRLAAERRKNEISNMQSDMDLLSEIVDDAPDPERIVEARSEVEALKVAMKEMPQRRRDILIAVAIDEIPASVIAARFGVTRRTVQTELKVALIHCAKLLDRELAMRMPSKRGRTAPHPNNGSEEGLLGGG